MKISWLELILRGFILRGFIWMGFDLNYLVGFNLVDDTDVLELERNLRKSRNNTFILRV